MMRDLSDIKGQEHAKRALEVAAAGGHSLLLEGPPGVGKTMLALRLADLLPPLSEAEAELVAASYLQAGLADLVLPEGPLFRAPHHTCSHRGLFGLPGKPGEVELSRFGVLFLDELTEFPRTSLERFDQPAIFEERIVVAAILPCPCGNLFTARCRCTAKAVERHQERTAAHASRFDLMMRVKSPTRAELDKSPDPAGTTAEVSVRVKNARQAQFSRQRRLNAFCQPGTVGGWEFARGARQDDRTDRVARTLADLAGTEVVTLDHAMEALALRGER